MSIAEKLTTIAENQQKVYDAGYAAGQAGGGGDKWQGLREVVAGKTTLERFFSKTLITEIPAGLDTSSCINFSYMFFQCTDLETVPEFDTSNGGTFRDMFNGCQWLKGPITLDMSNILSGQYSASNIFSWCNNRLKKIVLRNVPSHVTYWASCFQRCEALEEIEGTLDFTSATNINSTFANCNALKEVRFAPNSIPISLDIKNSPLSVESAISIINGLVDYSADETKAFTCSIKFSSTTLDLLTAEGATSPIGTTWIEYIQAKGWNT